MRKAPGRKPELYFETDTGFNAMLRKIIIDEQPEKEIKTVPADAYQRGNHLRQFAF